MENETFTQEIVYQWQKTWSAKNLEKSIENCGHDKILLPFFMKYLSKDGPSLECGCGLGQWVVYLGKLGYPMAGIDIVPECVRICKEYYPHGDVREGDVRHLPFPDRYFTGYISIGVFEHMIEGPETTMREMGRVLKPGGIAIILVPSFNYFMQIWYPVRKIIVDILRNNQLLRRLLGKTAYSGNQTNFKNKFEDIKKCVRSDYWPIIGTDPQKGPLFIEYKCKKNQIPDLLKSMDFQIIESVPIHHPFIFGDVFGTIFFANNGDDSM